MPPQFYTPLLLTILLAWSVPCALLAQDHVLPTENTPIKGFWYDSESNGFYEFRENGSFFYETKDGVKHEGTYEPSGKDQDGNYLYRAKYIDVQSGEERSLFIRVNRDGRSGYTQYKCTKYPFYRSIES